MKKYFTIFIFLNIISVFAAHAQADTKDSLALVDLYKNTNGTKWYNKTNWLTKNPLNTWFGIRLLNNRVDSVILDRNNLKGFFSPSIGDLTNVRYLSFRINELYDSIPNTAVNLLKLEHFDCYSNSLTKLTYSLLLLNNLKHLDLSSNDIRQPIPVGLGALSNLTYLNLSENNFVDTIPASIGKLTKLKYLSLYQNLLEGQIPASIGNLVNLDTLIIADNIKIKGPIPGTLAKLSNLRYLDIYYCSFGGEIPAFLGNLQKLETLSIGFDKFEGEIPASLGNLTHLTNFSCNANKLTGNFPESFKNLKNLTFINAADNKLSGNIPLLFGSLTNLVQLLLYNNFFYGSLPDTLSNLNNLRILELSNNKLSGKLPRSYGKLSGLYTFRLSRNFLKGEIPKEYSSLVSLSQFDVSSNRLTSLSMNFYFVPKASIDLSDNELSGDVQDPERGYNIPLNVSYNRYNFTALEHLVQDFYRYGSYSPQKEIAIQKKGDTLSVNAGGTLSNNTYKWYKNGKLYKTIAADSTLITTAPGDYYATATNKTIDYLTLQSDTINVFSSAKNLSNQQLAASAISIYPNPATTYIQVNGISKTTTVGTYILTEEGKRIKEYFINEHQSKININGLAAGIYFIQLKEGEKISTFKFVKQ